MSEVTEAKTVDEEAQRIIDALPDGDFGEVHAEVLWRLLTWGSQEYAGVHMFCTDANAANRARALLKEVAGGTKKAKAALGELGLYTGWELNTLERISVKLRASPRLRELFGDASEVDKP